MNEAAPINPGSFEGMSSPGEFDNCGISYHYILKVCTDVIWKIFKSKGPGDHVDGRAQVASRSASRKPQVASREPIL
jgi:hypothetical protein